MGVRVSAHLFVVGGLVVVSCFDFGFREEGAAAVVVQKSLLVKLGAHVLLVDLQSAENLGARLRGLTHDDRVSLLGMLLLSEVFGEVVITLSLVRVLFVKTVPRNGPLVRSHVRQLPVLEGLKRSRLEAFRCLIYNVGIRCFELIEVPRNLLLKPIFEHDIRLIKRVDELVTIVRPLRLAFNLPILPIQLHTLLKNMLHIFKPKRSWPFHDAISFSDESFPGHHLLSSQVVDLFEVLFEFVVVEYVFYLQIH